MLSSSHSYMNATLPFWPSGYPPLIADAPPAVAASSAMSSLTLFSMGAAAVVVVGYVAYHHMYLGGEYRAFTTETEEKFEESSHAPRATTYLSSPHIIENFFEEAAANEPQVEAASSVRSEVEDSDWVLVASPETPSSLVRKVVAQELSQEEDIQSMVC